MSAENAVCWIFHRHKLSTTVVILI